MYILYAVLLGAGFFVLFIMDITFAITYAFTVVAGCLLKAILLLKDIKSNQVEQD